MLLTPIQLNADRYSSSPRSRASVIVENPINMMITSETANSTPPSS